MLLLLLLLLGLYALYDNRAAIVRDYVFYIAFAVGFVTIGFLVLWVAVVTGSDVAALLTLMAVAGLAGVCI